MLKGNVVYFGYGTVGVRVNSNDITFSEISPPQIVGELFNSNEVEYIRAIKFDYQKDEFKRLLNDLRQVNTTPNRRVSYQRYFLDFKNADENSIKVVEKAILHFVEPKIYIHK